MMRAWSHSATWAVASLLLLVACEDTADDPLGAPTAFRATPATSTVALAWKAADDAAGTAIVRWPAEPSALPADAVLDVGRSFGEGVVLYTGDGETFVDRTIEGCAPYVYQAFSVVGASHSEPASVTFDASSAVAAATAPPSSLAASFEKDGVRLTWTAPKAATDHVRVVRRLGAAVAGPDDGEIIATERSADEYFDPVSGANGAPGLEPGGTYFYGVFACDACERCETAGAHADIATPIALGDAPTDLEVDPDGATVRFSWNAPKVGSFVSMRLFMRVGAPVEGPDDPDAEVLYEGAENEVRIATATFLPDVGDDERHYHFAVHACAGESCSEGAAADRAFSLGDALRGGGYVVYFRHAEAGICVDRTDLGTAEETSTPDWWKSCVRSCDVATAEQLSASGFEDAEAAGLALRNAGVPVGRVLTSEYCRAVETADRLELLLPDARETRSDLTPFVYGTDDDRCAATQALVGGAALGGPDDNAVLVGHGGLAEPPEACAELEALDPGEALVFRPGVGALARVRPREWGEVL